MQEVVIEIGGMTCGHCEERVAKALRAVPGVFQVHVSRSEGQAVATADTAIASAEKLRDAVAGSGYEVLEVRFPE